MALAHAILTILTDTPSSGYDIGKRFEEQVSCFWKASSQQIYRELTKMEQQGWLQHEVIAQTGKPDKKLYSLTAAGRQEWQRWYTAPTEPTPIREDLLVKVLAGAHVAPEQVRQAVLLRRHRHAQQLQLYRRTEAEEFPPNAMTRSQQFSYLTLRRGLRYEQDWLAWCDEVLTFLDEQAAADSPSALPDTSALPLQ
ncbi:MAG: PadR family transcriptional regulator [Spirulinaceae cyanobacterium RM2_2_10]|nr:PadR family transcriptional regulator [Spirulinaceae cyanobacterium SM2_1_0]NJO19066.1 PadR family transcriptional regulator [Spirulinaceae cyanobacterium RM2_2_10]